MPELDSATLAESAAPNSALRLPGQEPVTTRFPAAMTALAGNGATSGSHASLRTITLWAEASWVFPWRTCRATPDHAGQPAGRERAKSLLRLLRPSQSVVGNYVPALSRCPSGRHRRAYGGLPAKKNGHREDSGAPFAQRTPFRAGRDLRFHRLHQLNCREQDRRSRRVDFRSNHFPARGSNDERA